MKNFYIFLDIDGVMYDWDYIVAQTDAGNIKRGSLNNFKPESIDALNFLIEQLEKTYNVQLVISSTWRADMPHCVNTLKQNGLIYDKIVERTPFSDPMLRGNQILEYLSDKQNYDFVIIDDEMFNFKQFFKKENIIKTEMYHDALSFNHIKNFLKNFKKLKKGEQNGLNKPANQVEDFTK